MFFVILGLELFLANKPRLKQEFSLLTRFGLGLKRKNVMSKHV